MAALLLSWRAPEFEYRPKGASWYWVSIIVAVLVLAAAIWQKNFLFAIFIIISEILILVWANREPGTTEFVLDERGLTISSRKFYAWNEIKSFGVVEGIESDWSGLVFVFAKTLRPPLRIPTPTEVIPEVRAALTQVIPETEVNESPFDTLERFVRF